MILFLFCLCLIQSSALGWLAWEVYRIAKCLHIILYAIDREENFDENYIRNSNDIV